MEHIEFEQLLGKDISFAREFCDCDFKKNKIGSEFYINNKSLNREYYGMPYNFITIMPDGKDTIQAVTIHFLGLVNREFYDSFIQDYGNPDSILVIENKRIVGESTTKDNNGKIIDRATKSEFDLREGTFEEEPLYIIWKKEVYKIKILMRQKSMSEITFSVLKKDEN